MTRIQVGARLGLLAALVSILSCLEIGTDPNAAVALEIDQPALPAIVVGDTLRDTLGRVTGIVARALNVRNEVIGDAPIRFLVLGNDSGIVELDTTTGVVVGRRVGQVLAVARVAGLQSARLTLRVTTRPDTVIPAVATERVHTHTFAAITDTAAVVVQRDSSGQRVGVPHYRVGFRIASPDSLRDRQDTLRAHLVSETGRPSTTDTTATTGPPGYAARYLRVPINALPPAGNGTRDSVIFVVEAHVFTPARNTLPGSPVRFRIIIRDPQP